MSRPGEQVTAVTGLLNNIAEDGTFVPPEDDEDYIPDINNDSEQEIDEEEIDDESIDQEIDQEEDTNEEDDEADEELSEDEEDTADKESEVQTINELAEFLEVEESQLYDIQIPLGDGLEPTTIGALKDTHTELERNKTQLVSDRALFDQEVEQFKAQISQQQELPAMNEELMKAAVAMESVKQQWANIDWDAFESQDAAKALLTQQKLERSFAQAEHQYKDILKSNNDKRTNALQQAKTESRTKILQKIPEWNDPKVFQREGDLIGNILTSYGYNPAEITEVYDPRLSLMLRDFMMLKTKADKAGATAKKLRLTPKKLPSSGIGTKKVVKRAQMKKTIEKAKKSRDVRDKVGAVSQLLNS